MSNFEFYTQLYGKGRTALPLGMALPLCQCYCHRISTALPLVNTLGSMNLGVHVDDNLSFKDHIYTKIKKANAVMGIIRRTFDYLDQNMFLQLFKRLVRPLIETSVAVWAPYKKTDIAELERVQRRATKQVPALKHLEYSERLKK